MSDTADNRFNDFVILQAQNAGLFLGQVPHPSTGEKMVNIQAADSVIASLEMLEEKTKGNLNDQEGQLLSSALNNLKKLRNEVSSDL